MRNRTNITRFLATVICHLLVGSCVMAPALAQARAARDFAQYVPPYELDVWYEGQHVHHVIPRDEELPEGDLITGDLQYEDLGDFFEDADVEVLGDDLILLDIPGGFDAELSRIGSSDWWALYGEQCECAGDMCACSWEYLATVVTDGFDLAVQLGWADAEYDAGDGEVAHAIGVPAAIVAISIAVIVVTVAVYCSGDVSGLEAWVDGHEVGITC